MYAGIGYDVHKFKKGRKLVLGGITIVSPFGLDGHSDADVIIHALMDALLGAAGLKDIGSYFPNNDIKFKGASSIKLLEEVVKLIKKQKLSVNNVDITVISQKPKIAPYIDKMKAALAPVLKIKKERIGIKATTNEKMGFIGRGEGMAAMSIATLK